MQQTLKIVDINDLNISMLAPASQYHPLVEPKTPRFLNLDLSLPSMACRTIPSSIRNEEPRLHNPIHFTIYTTFGYGLNALSGAHFTPK